MLIRRFCLLIAAIFAIAPASAVAQEPPGAHSPNMTYVKNIPYEQRAGTPADFGTDVEFTRIRGKQYGLFGSYRQGMYIVDISKPQSATVAGIYDCGITQGDVQIFRDRGRTYATYTSDTTGDGTSTCYQEAAALGYEVKKSNGSGKNGTFIVDVSSPSSPKTVSFIEVPQGSHNMTVHPSGDWLYNSNSDLITSFQPAIEIFDISNPKAPVSAGELAIPTRPGLGTESHDIGFSTDGNRAYSAALSQGVIIDTTDPGNPELITSFLDPAINVWHQMEDITIGDRQFLIAEDEYAGAAGGPHCPSGGVHVYDITGDKVASPEKVGYWNIDDARTTTTPDGRCTAHVFQLHEDAQVMTIAYYNGGVRVVDLSDLAGVSLGENNPAGGMKELGFYRIDNHDTWSAKTPAIERGEPFYLYGNDQNRGIDIYRFDWEAEGSTARGQWMSPAEALELTQQRGTVSADYRMNCLLAG